MKRHSPKFVSESNIRYCLYDGCESPLNEGEYYCIQHGVEALGKWCYTCRDFTGFKYDTWSMGVAGSTNPRWSEVTYANPTDVRCIRCGMNPLTDGLSSWIVIACVLLISLYFFLNSLPRIIAEAICGILITILVIITIIGNIYLKVTEEPNYEMLDDVKQKIVDELRKSDKNVSTSNIKTVLAHIQGKHLPFRVKLDFDQALTVKEDYD